MQRSKLFGEALVEQARDRLAHRRRIRDVGVAHAEREPRGLEREMQPLRPCRIELADIELFENVQQHQCGEPLPVRRQLDDVEPAIVRADRRDDVAMVAREIVGGQQSALLLNRRGDVGRDRALVKRLRATGRDRLQGRGKRGQCHDAADRRRRAVRQIILRRARMRLELGGIIGPIGTDARRDDVTILGVTDGRLQRAVEAEAPMRFQNRVPGFDRARHRDGVRRGRHDLAADAGGQHFLRRHRRGRAAGAVVAPHRLVGLRHQAEAIAADAGHRGLDHAQHRHRSNCRIRRGAAGFERFDRREACERMRGRGHSFARINGRAAGQVEIACFHCPGANVAGRPR